MPAIALDGSQRRLAASVGMPYEILSVLLGAAVDAGASLSSAITGAQLTTAQRNFAVAVGMPTEFLSAFLGGIEGSSDNAPVELSADQKALAISVGCPTSWMSVAMGVAPTAPAQPTFIFTSDWGTALGGGDAALRDTNQTIPWTDTLSPTGDLDVVSSVGFNFPTTNILRVVHLVSPGFGWIRKGSLGLPAVGQTRYYRYYCRNEIPDSEGTASGTNHHPVETSDGLSFTAGWEMQFGWNPDGTFPPYMTMLNTTPAASSQWRPRVGGVFVTLQKFHTYRFEWAFTRGAVADTWTFQARTYNESGTLVHDSDTWCQGSSPFSSMTVAGVNVVGTNSDSEMDGFRMGNNGGPAVIAPCYHYFGGVAISDEDWCGEYVAGEHT